MNVNDAIAALTACAVPENAAKMAAYHKVDRPYLGTSISQIDALAKHWRNTLDLDVRLALANDLWETNIHEARIAAAKLLTQARIRPDDTAAWALICKWMPDLDAWAIADHLCSAAQRRISADLSRLDQLEAWTTAPNVWTRRAALTATLPLARLNHPKADDIAARDRILDWAASYVGDRNWFIQKAVADWVRDLSRHDAPRAAAFLVEHGAYLKTFARKEAAQHLPPV